MSYSEFTLESVTSLLGVVTQPADLFPDLRPIPVPDWLQATLVRGTQEIQLSLISEKARSEFIVAPILLASRELRWWRRVIEQTDLKHSSSCTYGDLGHSRTRSPEHLVCNRVRSPRSITLRHHPN